MSDISCDRTVIMADYLSPEVLSNTFQYTGPVGRVATQYRRQGHDYIHISPEDQGRIHYDN